MTNKIRIEPKVLKALSSDTRRDILGILQEKQKTVTKLSNMLDISKSTAHEHLNKLLEAGLVEKLDGHNKWVYYALTKRGREILNPHDSTKIILFTVSIIGAFIGGLIELYNSFNIQSMETLYTRSGGAAENISEPGVQWSWPHLAISIVLLLVCIYLAYRFRKYLK